MHILIYFINFIMCIFFLFCRLHSFPTAKKNHDAREKWKILINRVDKTTGKLWSPSKDMRVCSRHFTDGEPTTDNPFPIESLGYDSVRRAKNIAPSSKRIKLIHNTIDEDHQVLNDSVKNEEYVDNFMDISGVETLPPDLSDGNSVYSGTNQGIETEPKDVLSEDIESQEPISNDLPGDVSKEPSKSPCTTSIATMQATLQTFKQKVKRLEWERKVNFQRISRLLKQLSSCKCRKPMHAKLLADDKSTKFLTGLDKKSLFDSLHDHIAPFVKRRFKGVSRVVNRVRRHIPGGRQRGPKRKLDSRDEFLLTMMKLRLALIINDLSSRFHISLCVAKYLHVGYVQWPKNFLR